MPFVPNDLDPSDIQQLEPLYQALMDRELDSPQATRQWLQDMSDLSETVGEYATTTNNDYARHTDDEQAEQRYLHLVENIQPKLKPWMFSLQKKYEACSHRDALERDDESLAVLGREWQADVRLFREENVPLQTEAAKQVKQFDKLCGEMLVEHDGRTQTLQQMGRYLEMPDRKVREEAWTKVQARRLEDRGAMDEIFNELITLRDRTAHHADCADYREYNWHSWHRFDYTPDDCAEFRAAVREQVLPVRDRMLEERRAAMQLETLKPWDTAVDPLGRPPLKPFDPEDIDGWLNKTREVFQRVSPKLAEMFASMKQGRNLDLESRKGKRVGGYQASLPKSREPFIFMNAAGLQTDVVTMVHEAGHAFHYMQAKDLPLHFLRQAPIEFCEVASMSMELLTMEHWGVFYDDDSDAMRAQRSLLERIATILPWIAIIDEFQHWLYTHPDHTTEQRTAQWIAILDTYQSGNVDYTGHEASRQAMWQKQMHLFHVPFYYIEYGIAQLGALQVWLNYRNDPDATLNQLLDAFALGGTRPLPELFAAAGLPFEFTAETFRPLLKAVQEELEKLPT